MLISQYLPVDNTCPYQYKIKANTRYFQIGSIGPDLPYASIIDNNFLENESDLADLFHFCKANQDIEMSPNMIPLHGLDQVKNVLQKEGPTQREGDALFWFLMGFASHVLADGICHPFIMDKVGRYEGSNKSDHRALEMGIDVLLSKHFTSASGKAIEASYAGWDTFIKGFNDLKYSPHVLSHFAELIKAIYQYDVTSDEISGWVDGISRLFCMSTGVWPDWFRELDITKPFVFRQVDDLNGHENEYLILGKPKYWDQNFCHKSSVSFLNDCLPQFYPLIKSFINKAYAYVYGSGPQLTQNDLPAFSLDTGRTVHDPNNIDLKPVLWGSV